MQGSPTDPPAPTDSLAQPPGGGRAEYVRITPEDALALMSGDVVILDVRTQEEFEGGHIRNAVLLPYDEIRERAESVIPEKSRTILVYCRSGRRSEVASRTLIDMGYTDVYDFGGILDWPGDVVIDGD